MRDSNLLRTEIADGSGAFLVQAASLLGPDQLPVLNEPNKGEANYFALIAAELATAKRTTAVTVLEGFKAELEFRLGPMGEPIAALQTCAADLVKSWGVDPQKVATMSRYPEPESKVWSWLNWSDYPPQMLRERRGGILQLRLIVGADGMVEQGRFEVETAGAFEQAACAGIKRRARFTPALDAQGQPMRTYWRQGVIFYP